ncbi:MAG: DUF3341 domain-containing protein [Deltaproteobacteria bacterium]|nr:DUF3341 domain-containing protein [Deltaproteobacteria bacterium]
MIKPKPFKGVWGSFEYLDETCSVIRKLREQKKDYSVLSPFHHYELQEAMGNPSSRIPFITLCFGGMGIFFGYGFPSWTALQWVLPVSAKPIVSIPPFTIIGFEMMVLLGGLSTALGMFVLANLQLRKEPLPSSAAYKNYGRFSNDRFGVVVRCGEQEAAEVERLMRAHSAEEVIRESN